jgi:hypothetical protein
LTLLITGTVCLLLKDPEMTAAQIYGDDFFAHSTSLGPMPRRRIIQRNGSHRLFAFSRPEFHPTLSNGQFSK